MVAQITAHNKIVLKAGYTEGGAEHDEGIASGTIYPGMAVVMTTAAEVSKRHTYAPGASISEGSGGVLAGVKIAKEDVLQGNTVDDAYTSGSTFLFHVCKSGDIVQVLVESGQTVTKGLGGAAVASGKWNTATTDAVGEFLEGSGGALAADTLMRLKVF